MCRLFGMSAGMRLARATFWLLGAPDSLSEQSHREPDGTGLGWFDAGGSPQVSKQPLAAYEDADFARQARAVASTTFLAHVRFASTGELSERNTHPFEQHGRLFAHNGVIEDLPTLERHLGAAIDLVEGETDSERFFALITAETASRNGDLAAGISAACSWIAANLPIFAINFVLSTADGLWALRYPQSHPLYVLEREPGEALEHSSKLGSCVRSQDGERRAFVVVASERMDEDPGWQELPSGELLHVEGSLKVSRHRVLTGAPTQLLSLSDLGSRGQASQSQSTTPARDQ